MKFIIFLNDEHKITVDEMIDFDYCIKQFDFVKDFYIDCLYDEYLKLLDMEDSVYDN